MPWGGAVTPRQGGAGSNVADDGVEDRTGGGGASMLLPLPSLTSPVPPLAVSSLWRDGFGTIS